MSRSTHTWRLVSGCLAALVLQAPMTASQAAPVQWLESAGGNGHWYDYVPAISIFAPVSLEAARSAATSSSHMGQAGYLASITSAAEQSFIQSSFGFMVGFGATGTAWLGASDADVEGQWRWMDGPQAGELVGYTDWLVGHPLESPGFEAYDYLVLHINAVVAGEPVKFGWASSPSGGAFGYVVEYGAGRTDDGPHDVPEPASGSLAVIALAAAGVAARRTGGRRRSAGPFN